MKKIVFAVLFAFCANTFAANESPATKDDIKLLIEQMDKRFEQIDKRFEQMDKRIDFLQSILYIVLGASIGAPFVAEYLARRKDKEFQEEHERVTKIIFALKDIAKDNPKIKESLQTAGIL